ncbi:MAG TPA: endonuclease/exonuclease/phosphatase family protein, partial [Nitrospiria bacterium]
ALQELDVGRRRTKKHDQAFILAGLLEMDHHFHPAFHVEEEKYGDAVLTRLPVRLIRAGKLPGLPRRPWREPRGAIWVGVGLKGRELQLINTHLGLSRRERQIQAGALLGPKWLGHPDCREPVILCGDFNALPGSPSFRLLTTALRDAQMAASDHRPLGTWFGRFPFNRIDHIFVDRSIQITGVKVPRTALTRTASDHLPLIVDLKF